MGAEVNPEDSANVDDFVAMTLLSAWGLESTPKMQMGEQQYECDVVGFNLTYHYSKDRPAIQFQLNGTWRHRDFFYIATQEQLDYMDIEFPVWLLTSLWHDEYIRENPEEYKDKP